MSKLFWILNLLILLVNIQSLNDCIGSASTVNECHERITDVEKNEWYHCCLLTGKPKPEVYQSTQCLEVSKEEYESFDDVMDFYKLHYNDLSIDCKSYYLYVTITFILLNFLY